MAKIQLPLSTCKNLEDVLRTLHDILPQIDALRQAGWDVSEWEALIAKIRQKAEVLRSQFCGKEYQAFTPPGTATPLDPMPPVPAGSYNVQMVGCEMPGAVRVYNRDWSASGRCVQRQRMEVAWYYRDGQNIVPVMSIGGNPGVAW